MIFQNSNEENVMPNPNIHTLDGHILLEIDGGRSSMTTKEALKLAKALSEHAQEEERRVKLELLRTYVHACMKNVDACTFSMGEDNGDSFEGPSHFVDITNDFLISSVMVSQRLYELVIEENPSRFIGKEQPVDMVSWYDAIRFCNRLSELLGYERCYERHGDEFVWHQDRNGFRLPTEAEWFCAARAGIDSVYSGGNDLSSVSGWKERLEQPPTPQSGRPNSFGLYDMSGMCFSWCYDYFGLFSMERSIDPKGQEEGKERVCRGGAWNRNAWFSRLSFRCGMDPMHHYNNISIRLARNIE